MKSTFRYCVLVLIFCAAFYGTQNAHAVMFPREVEGELQEKEVPTQPTNNWKELEKKQAEIQKLISELQSKENEAIADFGKLKETVQQSAAR